MSTDYLTCKNFLVYSAPGYNIRCEAVLRFLSEAKASALFGRSPLLEGVFQGQHCVLRRFSHGGILRKVLQGRYLARIPRAVSELNLLAELKEEGFPVVEPVFAIVEKHGPGYAQAIATVRLADAVDLNALPQPPEQGELEALLILLERFFDTGLYHPDLNIKNILRHSGTGEFFLLDFDRAVRLPGPLAPPERGKIYRRFFRSFDKSGKLGFWDHFPFETLPPYIGNAMRQYRKIRGIRAFFWKLNQK